MLSLQNSPIRRYSLFAGLCILLAAAAGIAQTPTPTPNIPEEDEVVKVNSRLVVIPVSVTDSSGQPVTGLGAKDFRVLEDGRPQEIDQVGNAEKVPLEIALLVDVSGSVNPLFDFEKEAASQFLRSVMKADDHATIFLIGDKPQSALVRENSTQAAARLATVKLSGKFTAFYDTVLLAADFLRKNAPIKSRKVILALTDGEDNWSDMTRDAEKSTYRDVDVNSLTQAKRNELAASTDAAHKRAQQKIRVSLQNADTVFYAINPAGGSFKLNKISQRAQAGMQAFADETGGTAYLPKFQPLDTKDALQNSGNARKNEATLEQIFRQLANELRAQYLVQYYSETEYPNNKFVKLDIALQAPAGRTIRARQGYYAKN